MTYQETQKYLNSFINYENKDFKVYPVIRKSGTRKSGYLVIRDKKFVPPACRQAGIS